MTGKVVAAWARAWAGVAFAVAAIGADAQQFVSPAGYSGNPTRPHFATPPEPNAPALTRVPDATLSSLFRVDPAYRRAAAAHANVVGAFAVVEPADTHLVAAWSPGFLPVTLSFSNGRCYSLEADYVGGTLSNGRLTQVTCEGRQSFEEPPAPPPSGRSLRLVGSAWGYGAWADDRTGTTIVTAPHAKTFEPLFTARMESRAIMAMNGPDWLGGNVTLVGRIDGRPMVVTLEVSY